MSKKISFFQTTRYFPWINAYTFESNTFVYRYSFGEDGVLLGEEKTGEIRYLWR